MNQSIQYTARSVSLILMVLATLMLVACSSSNNDGGNPARNYFGTQSPGDVWTWTITTGSGGRGTFSARNETLRNEYTGNVETLANGFLKLTVITTTGPGPAFTPKYALEFPGTALLIIPAGSGNAIVAAALGLSCPETSATYNWVDLLDSLWDPATDQAYGVSLATVTGPIFDFSNTNYMLDGSVSGTDSVAGFTCAAGKLTHPTDPTVMIVTPSGAFIGDSGASVGAYVGMQAPVSDIDLSDVVLAGREYRGVDFEDASSDPTRDDTTPVWGRPDGSGGLNGGEWVDFEANVETTDAGTITFGAQNSPGIVNATLDDGAGTTDMVLMINRISGKYFIYGAQVNTASGKGANFLAIEQ